MQTITGHLTATEKKHIKAILAAGFTTAKVNRKTYQLSQDNGIYTVLIHENGRGLGFIGSELRPQTSKKTFKL